jgi:two-component system, cell cycle sensor histidine kinase and response regulator CckA
MEPSPQVEELTIGAGTAALKITRQVSARIGGAYFRAISTHLRQELNADCLFVGEFTHGLVERVTTLAACFEGERANLSFDLAGSVCSRVAGTRKPYICREDAQKRFPKDQMLRRVNAAACIAVPLQDPAARAIGVMLATYRQPLASLSTAKSVLEFFAGRAAAELVHKQEKDKLRKSEQRYRAFITLNADGMWCVEFDQPIPTELPVQEQFDLSYQRGYFSECNDAMAKLMGVDHARQIVGRRTVDVLPKMDPSIRGVSLELIRSRYRFTTKETAAIAPDGKCHFVLLSQWGIVEDGMLQRIWGVTHDITEFKQVQRALDSSKQRIADVFEAVQLLVLVLDLSGAIRFCNNYFTELTGWQSDVLKGKSYFDLIVPEERAALQAKFAAWIAGLKGPIHFESALLGPDGRRRRVAWDSTAFCAEEESAKLISNIGRDITQERALEAHVQQAQKIEIVGRLAGGVAHDFNNLLTLISGNAADLLEKHSPTDSDYPGLTEILNAAAKGARLTQQLLAFSRRQPYEPVVLNLNTIVEQDSSMLRRTLGGNIELITHLDPLLGLIRADPGNISQILLNLAVNARDAMPEGGNLTTSTSNASLSDEEVLIVPGVPPGEYVQLTITDTGTGMIEEVLNHLFEPFFTTKEPGKGTGLGLSIVYGIVQQSGGYIRVESQLGHGTSIRIFLPRAQEEPSPTDPGQEKTEKLNVL